MRLMRWVLRSKIHKATVTEANVNYIGSITIDRNLVEKVGFWHGESPCREQHDRSGSKHM